MYNDIYLVFFRSLLVSFTLLSIVIIAALKSLSDNNIGIILGLASVNYLML